MSRMISVDGLVHGLSADYCDRDFGEIQGVAMFKEIYKFISRLYYGIKFMPEKDFNELLSRCDWEQKIYALFFRYW